MGAALPVEADPAVFPIDFEDDAGVMSAVPGDGGCGSLAARAPAVRRNGQPRGTHPGQFNGDDTRQPKTPARCTMRRPIAHNV